MGKIKDEDVRTLEQLRQEFKNKKNDSINSTKHKR